MVFKAAEKLYSDSEKIKVFVIGPNTKYHKFDPVSKLCTLCLNHQGDCYDRMCSGLLDPTICVEIQEDVFA